MFNKNFYPTPDNVIDMLGVDCQGKVVLEPSAGKGNIVEWLKANGAKEVLACEKNTDLAEIVKSKCKFIQHDFLKLTSDKISHIDMIVMNPPFDKGLKHLLHAWEIAPSGCEIICLVNTDNLTDYSQERRELLQLLQVYGIRQDLGQVFQQAERKTAVEVTSLKLFKPKTGAGEFDGFFLGEFEEQVSGAPGIMQYNVVRDIVNRYVEAVRLFEEHEKLAEKMEGLTSMFGVGNFKFEIGYNENIVTKAEFKIALQKKGWEVLFDKMNLKRFVTKGVMDDINKFVNTQTQVPFTMPNIYKMFEIIVGTREQTYNRSLIEAVDNFTKHTHENRYAVEGWKTNEGHLLNERFIVPFMVEPSFSGGISTRSSSNVDRINDLTKVMCSLVGNNYDDIIEFRNALRYPYQLYKGDKFYSCFGNKEEAEREKNRLYQEGVGTDLYYLPVIWGQWFVWGFFECRCYKKGTVHFKFKDRKHWELINRKYAEIKGQVLPEKI